MRDKLKAATSGYLIIILMLNNSLTGCLMVINEQFSLDTNPFFEFQLQWSYKTGYTIFNSPSVADINGDGLLEVLIGTLGNELLCISPTGKLLWKYKSQWQIAFTSPAISDVDNDGFPEIIFGNRYLYCLSKDGTEKWLYKLPNFEQMDFTALIADIDNDTVQEILFYSRQIIYCVNGFGSEKWIFNLPEPSANRYFIEVVVADINNDTNLETLALTFDGSLYCLNSEGKLLWSVRVSTDKDKYTFDVIAADIDTDGNTEIFIAGQKFIKCLNSSGQFQWLFNSSSDFVSPLALFSTDNSGNLALICGTNTTIYALNSLGIPQWQYHNEMGVKGSFRVTDFNGDNKTEIVFSDANEQVLCLNFNSAEVISQFHLLNFDVKQYHLTAGFCIADINADSISEILIPSYEYIYCLAPNNLDKSGISTWYTQDGSICHNGAPDSDGDLIDDINEQYYHTDPLNADSDGDGLIDGLEVQVGLNPLVPDADDDLDGDGLTNYAELKEYHTSVYKSDTDHDHLNDGWEVNHHHNPLKWDNWALLFGVYLLPAYVIVIVTVVITRKKILKIQLKSRKKS